MSRKNKNRQPQRTMPKLKEINTSKKAMIENLLLEEFKLHPGVQIEYPNDLTNGKLNIYFYLDEVERDFDDKLKSFFKSNKEKIGNYTLEYKKAFWDTSLEYFHFITVY